MPTTFIIAEAGASGTVDNIDFSPLISSLSATLTSANIISLLAYGISSVVAIVFAWWGLRKLAGMFMKAFKRGKLRV